MVIAYLREGTSKQHLDEQRDEIKHFASGKGVEIDKWVTETASEKVKDDKRSLDLVIARMMKGDILIVSDISRLGRTLSDVMSLLVTCMNKGVNLYSIKDRYILDDKYDTKVMANVFSMAADIEHSLMSTRTKEALAHRKIKGVPVGRPKGSDAKQSFLDKNREELINMLERGETVETICKHFNVSRNTYYQFRRNYKI